MAISPRPPEGARTLEYFRPVDEVEENEYP